MRRRGSYYREIRETLGIPKSTLSGWFRNLLLTEEEQAVLDSNVNTNRIKGRERAHAMIRARNRAARDAILEEAEAEITELTPSQLFVAGIVAYMAEGTKSKPWRPSYRVRFINSDPRIIRLFLSWLDLVGVKQEDRSFRVAIHEYADVTAATEYWAGVIELSPDIFKKATLKKHNPKSTRKNQGSDYHGCLVVHVAKSSRLYLRIEGWFKAIADQLEKPL